ncbi:hypothetical protein DAD186_17020 [Dermabacter vaginalis]|uniref:Uncharacterized protein n=1 Tax=Dermabacter vaginalis TaxID=1630135 RepID=A0A1B0ZK63_9MICO|nr:hypothetical protein DAD186_17020 [Dermabacter vaginalis]
MGLHFPTLAYAQEQGTAPAVAVFRGMHEGETAWGIFWEWTPRRCAEQLTRSMNSRGA